MGMAQEPMELRGKKVTVVGLGNSGFNAASLLLDQGAEVWATDGGEGMVVRENAATLEGRGVHVETGRHTELFVRGSALVVVSPGVEDSSWPVRWAIQCGIPLIGEMELGYRYCRGRIIGITGTNGKSTVTTLIGDIMKAAGQDTVVCGNIGNSLCGEISRIGEKTWVVLEVSSFQLEKIERFRPHIALILNITDDHMDRYTRFDQYVAEKLKIFRYQTRDDRLILNYDASNLRRLSGAAPVFYYSRLEKVTGAYLDGDDFVVSAGPRPVRVCSRTDLRLKGVHNVENVLACILAGVLAGADPAAIRQAVREFRGLHHRVETVDVVDGVEYIDDSKGTTVDSTRRALESFAGKVILIAGGKDKQSDYAAVKGTVRERVRHLILIGEAKRRIRAALGDAVDTRDAADMHDAVRIAHSLANAGSVVLLSPMCSSFDMYRDYKHRGQVFREAVLSLKGR